MKTNFAELDFKNFFYYFLTQKLLLRHLNLCNLVQQLLEYLLLFAAAGALSFDFWKGERNWVITLMMKFLGRNFGLKNFLSRIFRKMIKFL